MKVVHFVANLSNLRGMERQALLQAKSLNNNKFKSELWTFTKPYKLVDYKEVSEIKIIEIGKNLKFKSLFGNLFIFFRLIFIRKEIIIHIHGLSECLIPFCLGKIFSRKKIRLLIKVQNSGKSSSIEKLKKKAKKFSKLLFLLAKLQVDKWVSINSDIRKELLSLGIDKNRIADISNGIEITRNDYKFEKNFNEIAWVGALMPHKNIDLLLGIAENMPENFKFYIYGKGPLKEDIINKIKNKRLANRIFYKGWLSKKNLFDALSKHGFYLSTSIAEGMSNSLLEAVSLKMIPICNSITPNKEMLGINYPLLISVKDPKQWASQIISSLDKKEILLEYLSQRLKKYDINTIKNRILKTYKDIL